jgi:hypothetical protein
MYTLLSGACAGERRAYGSFGLSVHEGGDLWGEFWWVSREYRWVFFDDETSETYAEQVTHCPRCGRPLERKNLKAASPFAR